MRLLRFSINDKGHIGVQLENRIIDLTTAAEDFKVVFPDNIESIIGKEYLVDELLGKIKEKSIDRYVVSKEELKYLPVSSSPEKIICVGVNYQEHADESNLDVLEHPVLFNKFNNSLHAHNEPIVMPKDSLENDYEAELAIMIGKEAQNITREEALQYVFGYTIANDVSSRDWQMRTHQWMLGKSVDQYCPIGPVLVTADEIDDPQQLDIQLYLNGEIRQHSNTSKMIYDCISIISYLSSHMTLRPGDIILTGTPEGVILGMDPRTRQYLQHGDETIIEIEGIGTLKNTFIRK
ncbi:fumarylacetoacetate hydrolase family protein [Oceanobacillus longus]|uniref:Fumarylacetoacetate hydrolase family protein n=1 Tax=Oceanobacillus longus TaxID=930120 RepID=A0ABV8H013_9BACI